MIERDDAAPVAVDEDRTAQVPVPPVERWADVIRGRANCAICGCFLALTDALPSPRGEAHFRCLAAAQLRTVAA